MAPMSMNKRAAVPLRILPAPAADLSGLEDRELLALAASLPRSSQRRAAARDLLVARHGRLVRSCVRRYSRSSEPTEDLMQAGYVGLLNAINNFDPALGFSLASYAAPCILGEIKRHFRDKSWQVRVGRQLQERVLAVREADLRLTQKLGRVPADSDLAGDLGISAAAIREARRAELMLQPLSLDEPLHGQAGAVSLADLIGAEDLRLEHMLGMQAIATHWAELPSQEQQIVVLYYYRGMTQVRIGRQLGISQMQVSRLLARALSYLRQCIFGQPGYVADAVLGPPPRTDLLHAAHRARRAGPALSAKGAQAASCAAAENSRSES